MLPKWPRRRQRWQAGFPQLRLGSVPDQNIILVRAIFERQRHRGAAGFGDVNKDEFAPGRNDHAPEVPVQVITRKNMLSLHLIPALCHPLQNVAGRRDHGLDAGRDRA